MKATIKELEKRRDQAIKEIKQLKHQMLRDKKKKEGGDKVESAAAVASA